MSQKRKTKPVGREHITRNELVVFARAVDARIAQEIQKLREELLPKPEAE